MTDDERAIIRKIYDLQAQLFRHQGEQIEGLYRSLESLNKSHAVIGELLELTAKLAGFKI